MKVTKNTIIESPKWSEPVIVELVEEFGEYIRIFGKNKISGSIFDKIIPKSEISTIKIKKLDINFSGNPLSVFLALETKRYRYISLYEPLLAINTSKVDPLPHQIEAVYDKILKLPRIRFLIADDPGAGKTIMAGLIIKELKIRKVIDRILIVTPGHLKDQWRRELKERFEESFVIIDRNFINLLYGENPWLREKQIITSIDFCKQDKILGSLLSSHFDLIIVDEAHKMSAYKYGSKTKKSKRYKLGESLSQITEHLLFLTATPHKGNPDNFRLFLDLLEPGFFSTTEMLEQSIKNKENPLFIRRLKEDLKDFEGKPLFLPRYVKTITYSIKEDSPQELELYNALSKYIRDQYNKALSKENKKRYITFTLIILQRRFASSIYALYNSLNRRKKKLQELLDIALSEGLKNKNKTFDFEDIEDLSEKERWEQEEIWETLSLAENREELAKEINILNNLISMAKKIIDEEKELKLKELKNTLEELNTKYKHEKIIIFTESKDTLEYLEAKLKQWKYSVITIHGGHSLEERIQAETIFRNERQVLVATEAAGEGINLQFCHIMINYDIPWNPNRLEQRMGRIHRYGQRKEVFVFNLVSKDTREGQVLNKLFKKLEEIKKALGSDKVFDVISEVFEGKNLSQLLIDAAVNARNQEEILKEIDIKVDKGYIKKVKDNLGDSLATRFIDYTRIKEMRNKALEYKLIPEYTENFFKKAFKTAAQGRLTQRKDGFITIESIPVEIKEIANEDKFKKKYGSILSKYTKATFDKDTAFKNPDAEFLSFGHPLFEAVLEWIDRKYSKELLKGATFYDPDKQINGYILYYECEIKDGKENIASKKLLSFYFDKINKKIYEVTPQLIWDLIPSNYSYQNNKSEDDIIIEIEEIKKKVQNSLFEALDKYKREIEKERKRQAEIKIKYGIKSLEYLIYKLNDELFELEKRKEKGENVDIAIRNKEERKRKYEKALENIKKNIQYETSISYSMPKFVGIIKVIPIPEKNINNIDYMVSDKKIEDIGMKIAIEYEKKQGRIPQDVSSQNLGFDIRSLSKDGNVERYIEVKARVNHGSVAFTQNEWFKAKRFKEKYFLYIILNATLNPELIIIQNPANNVKIDKKVEIVRYIIPQQEILNYKRLNF